MSRSWHEAIQRRCTMMTLRDVEQALDGLPAPPVIGAFTFTAHQLARAGALAAAEIVQAAWGGERVSASELRAEGIEIADLIVAREAEVVAARASVGHRLPQCRSGEEAATIDALREEACERRMAEAAAECLLAIGERIVITLTRRARRGDYLTGLDGEPVCTSGDY